MFFFLDKIIYQFVAYAYQLFYKIATTTIFTNDMIEAFAGKVYALIGIFMLFKVSFSILTYIVNPDEFTDKNKGMSKLATNIVTSLVMLILVPLVFNEAMTLQKIILNDNVIPNLFSTNTVSVVAGDSSVGTDIAFQTFSAFYHAVDSNGEIIETSSTFYELFGTNVNEKTTTGEYSRDYYLVISTVVGIILLLIFISFCIDIAVRSIKLGALRLLAPIPIIARIDPKKGNEIFNNWVKTCVSTYLDLFIRLAAVFFAIYIIQSMQKSSFVDSTTGEKIILSGDITGSNLLSLLTMVFIILGTLLFAKQLPKLISDLTGIKLDGKFSLSPLKKIGEAPLIGGAMAAGGALGVGAALAGGRGLANLAGGGLKLGTGALLNSLTGGTYGSGLMSSGKMTLGNTRNAMQTRLDYTKQEAMNRLNSSGLMGGEFKGDTAHKMFQKENEKSRNAALEGKQRQDKLTRQLEEGKMYSNKIASGQQIFDSKFQKSKNDVDAAKGLMYQWQNYASKAQADYQAAVSTYGANSSQAQQAYSDLEKANQYAGMAKGQYEYRNKLHDSLRQQMPKMAEIEDAIEAYEKTGGKAISTPPTQAPTPAPTPTPAPAPAPAPSSNSNSGGEYNVEYSEPASINSNVTTPQGVRLEPGERMTKSGIIIPADVDVDKK
jgi:hypothetical protein